MTIHKAFPVILSAILMLGLQACEKTVDFELKDSEPKVVVDGSIETGVPPYVFLTRSIGFFSTIDFNTLSQSFLHDAEIIVSNGHDSVRLIEYQIDNQGIPFYFYTVDSTDINALLFTGVSGMTYSLTIRYQNHTYRAQTAIPAATPLDSLWSLAPPPEELPDDFSEARVLYARYTDPDTPGNRIRYFTKRNDEAFLAPLFSVSDDAVINGATIDLQLTAGISRSDTGRQALMGYFSAGDTVVIKWCAIDKGVFDFWRTLEFSYGATGNPFASPVQITSNISNGALGVWAGYASSYDTIVIAD